MDLKSWHWFYNDYCRAREFVVPAHFTLGPKAQAEETYCQGRIMKAQKRPKDVAKDDPMLSTL